MILISGQEVEYRYLSFDDAIEERSVCGFEVIDREGELGFRKGQQIEVFDQDYKKIFGGVIEYAEERPENGDGVLFHRIDAIDWHYLADKRIIANAYANEYCGNIARDICENYLDIEGVIPHKIEDGPLVNEAVFNYIPISDALNAVAEKAGFWWKIDAHKRLHFISRKANLAPFSVNEDDMLHGSISVEHGNPSYRNRQYIKGGRDITDPQTETERGNGEAQSFVVGFPIAKVPTVEVNRNNGAWEPQTVGIRGVETERQWYWSKGSTVISQENTATPLGENDRIRITYQGEFDIVVLSEDMAEISNRQDIEGGSGIIENIVDEPYNTNRNAAFQSANSKLQKYAVIGRRLKFRTRRKGIESGQLLTVNLPRHQLNEAEMLVESVLISESSGYVTYTVTAVEGPVTGSWGRLFHAMATRGQAFVIRENISEEQILVTLAQFAKTWTETEKPNIFKKLRVPFKPNGVQPTFKYNDRVKYLAWFNGDTELGRKVLTRREGLSTDDIQTITFLSPSEANAELTHLGWFGGWKATSQVGTGILVDKQQFSKNKTELEAIQVDKTDKKG